MNSLKADRGRKEADRIEITTTRWALSGSTGIIYKPALHILIVILLGFVAYSNTFQSPFQWDEAVYLKEKPFIKDLSYFASPSRAEGEDGLPLKSRYIGYLTFALNYRLHGFDVFGYHLVNLLIHLINAVLVYFLVLLTFRTPFFLKGQSTGGGGGNDIAGESSPLPYSNSYAFLFSLAVSLLFVAHPVQTEAVTYVFQRLASLVTMFFLLALVLYIKGTIEAMGNRQSVKEKPEIPVAHRLSPIAYYLLALGSAVCAMKTKENAFTLPVVIALYDFLFFTGSLKSRAVRLLPFLLTMAIIPFTLVGIERPAGEIMNQLKDPASLGVAASRSEYFLTQFRVIVTYLRLLCVPVNQTIYYDYHSFHSFFQIPVLLSAVLLAGAVITALFLIYRSGEGARGNGQAGAITCALPRNNLLMPKTWCYRLIGFGIIWFFITLSVESSIIPIAMLIDEYRIYLPSVGFFIAITAVFFLLLNRLAAHTATTAEDIENSSSYMLKPIRLALCAFLIPVLALASATYARNAVWKDKITLWEDVVRKSPGFPLGYVNLGLAYYEKGLYQKAVEMDERAIELLPVYLDAYINLGAAYTASGRNDMAIAAYSRALSMYPENGILHFNMAHAYAVDSQPGKAIEHYMTSLRINPLNHKAYHDLGTVYARLGRFDEAIAAYTKFAELSPNDPEAYRNRAIVYEARGDLRNAWTDYQRACALGNQESCQSMGSIH